ncbi:MULTISPECIES: DUF1654 domain-containing protein [unclassified Pseudomonas]|uniref:DUF1654 domain-containing protein n=1 Tax=unclassified Pseudomonas TaxID=196821 RepID=UPI00140332EC|nr:MULTISPECIES: DUF1654 domain-containing protein [unclassified Pseudomonas]
MLSPAERLSIRVSNMVGHPASQARRMVVIHQLHDDPDDVWQAMLEGIGEVDGLGLTHNDDGTVTLEWEPPEDEQVPDWSDLSPSEDGYKIERVG